MKHLSTICFLFLVLLSNQTFAQNHSLTFDGINDYVSLPDLSESQTGTIEMWIRPNSTGLDNTFLCNGGLGNLTFSMYITSNYSLVFGTYSGSYWEVLQTSAGEIVPDKWNHIAVTWSQADDKKLVYINGVEIIDGSCDGLAGVNDNWLLGRSSTTGSFTYFSGKIDEVRIWNTVRTQVQIRQYICESLAGSESGLVAYYKMTDGSGTSLTDNSSNSNTGTLYDGFLAGNGPIWTIDFLIPQGDGTLGNEYLIEAINHLYWISQNSGEWGKLYKQTANIDASATTAWGTLWNYGWIPIGNTTTKFTGKYNGQDYLISDLYISRTGNYQALFGYTDGATIEKLGVVNVSISGCQVVGSLIGKAENTTVSQCYSTGRSSGGLCSMGTDWVYTGGFIGIAATNSNIENCYSRTDLNQTGQRVIAGFISHIETNTEITNCYSTGAVGAGTSQHGGFIGSYNIPVTVTDCFWDTGTSGYLSSALGTAKTTEEMKTASTFSEWNSSIWNIDGGINDGYPYLDWQNAGGTPLPVELISFSASYNENGVLLIWQTATEVNNYGFEIQRSFVGTTHELSLQWETVGFVEGHGNSNSPKEYTFTDNKTSKVFGNLGGLDGKLQYRLKQIDCDGKFEYSETITLESLHATTLPTEYALQQNYPNPFNPTTSIEYLVPSDEIVSLKVYDVLGNEVATLVNEQKLAGKYEVKFNASNLASGIYIYKINAGKFNSVRKMMFIK